MSMEEVRAKQPGGTGILFVDLHQRVLLFLRDQKPGIPYPNCWDIPGGHMEAGETPEQCIRREMREEIGEIIPSPIYFRRYESAGMTHHIFWQFPSFDPAKVKTAEGRGSDWFNERQLREFPAEQIAFDFKQILVDFFDAKPFRL